MDGSKYQYYKIIKRKQAKIDMHINISQTYKNINIKSQQVINSNKTKDTCKGWFQNVPLYVIL